jgi:hypothetical protein
VELTVEEHSLAHKNLFEQHGRWQDKVAWMGLANMIGKEEVIEMIQRESKIGRNNPQYGKPAPNRGVKRPGVGGRKKGTAWTPEERAAQEKLRSVEGYYDYLKDPIRCKNVSEGQMGREGVSKGKKWYHNGTEEKYSSEPIEGWTPGRLNHTNSQKIGLRWYTDGVVDRQFKEGQQPENFVAGRKKKNVR